MSGMGFAEAFPIPAWDQWRSAVVKVLKGSTFEDALVGRSADGFAIQPLYARANGPIVAGKRAASPWHVTVRVDHPEVASAAASAVAELENGANSLALVMQGNRFARGHGLWARSADELDATLENIDLPLIHIWIEPGASVADSDLITALVERRGHAPEAIDVDFGVDPIGEAGSTGHAPANMKALGDRLHGAFDRLRGRGFRGPILRADGRSYHEAGASQGQELACVLATLVDYLRALDACGVAPSEGAAAMSVALAADSDQLLTIAKFRALRRLWDRTQRGCGIDPLPIALHAETSWRMLTRRDPWANILRGTIAGFSAGVGGADSVGVLPFDIAIGLPDTLARRVARNTQLILQHEAHLWRVVDPAAGSGGIEAMTDELCRGAWSVFQQIERDGGMLRSMLDGRIAALLEPARNALLSSIATRRQPITGTSAFPNLGEARLQRAAGCPGPVATTEDQGLLGPVPILPGLRLSECFESMRDRSEAAGEGRAPRVFIAELGNDRIAPVRAAFARDLFAIGGIASIVERDLDPRGEDTASDVAARWKASGASLFCLCASADVANSMPHDATHPTDTLAEAIGRSVRQAGAEMLFYGDDPGGAAEALRSSGFSHFLAEGCDVVAVLDASLTAHSSWRGPA